MTPTPNSHDDDERGLNDRDPGPDMTPEEQAEYFKPRPSPVSVEGERDGVPVIAGTEEQPSEEIYKAFEDSMFRKGMGIKFERPTKIYWHSETNRLLQSFIAGTQWQAARTSPGPTIKTDNTQALYNALDRIKDLEAQVNASPGIGEGELAFELYRNSPYGNWQDITKIREYWHNADKEQWHKQARALIATGCIRLKEGK